MNAGLRKMLARFGDRKAQAEEREAKFHEEAEARREKFLKNQKQIVNPYRLSKQVEQDEREESEHHYRINKRKFAQSRTGRTLSAIRNPTKFFYGKDYHEKSTKEKIAILRQQLKLQRLKNQINGIQNSRQVNNQIIRANMQKQQAKNYYDWCVCNFDNPVTNIPMQVENEIMRMNGFGTEGSMEALNVDRIALGFGNTATILPLLSLNSEVNILSNQIP